MRYNYRIKYPKLLFFIIALVIGFIVFYEGLHYAPLHNFIVSLGYFGTFIGGLFYAYGFTAPPATAVLLVLAKEQYLILSVLIGGLGAVISDFLIFKFVRFSFNDEINRLKKETLIRKIEKMEKKFYGRLYEYIFPTFAGFLIASPLPTEIGVSMMASIEKLSTKRFLIIAYLLHSLGIAIILTIGVLI